MQRCNGIVGAHFITINWISQGSYYRLKKILWHVVPECSVWLWPPSKTFQLSGLYHAKSGKIKMFWFKCLLKGEQGTWTIRCQAFILYYSMWEFQGLEIDVRTERCAHMVLFILLSYFCLVLILSAWGFIVTSFKVTFLLIPPIQLR